MKTVAYVVAYPHRLAGANRSLFELVTHLPEGYRSLVLVTAEGAVAQAYRDAGVDTLVLPTPEPLNRFGGALLREGKLARLRLAGTALVPFWVGLRRLLRERKVGLVHVNDPRGAFLAAPAARLAGLPVVGHLRGELVLRGLPRAAFETLTHRLIAVSEGARQTLSPAGRDKCVTVYNGIGALPASTAALPYLAALRRQGVVVVGCFASVVPFKGLHHLLRAAALLGERGLADRFAIVCAGDLVAGYEDYQAWLQSELERLRLRNVTFAGWQADPFAFYRHVDVSVLPSVSHERLSLPSGTLEVRGSEGFPRTHLEAMAAGLPVIGTRIAGVPEQVADGDTGLLVPPGDAVALAGALARLIDDAALRARLGAAGRERVQRLFSTAAYVRGVTRVYDELPA